MVFLHQNDYKIFISDETLRKSYFSSSNIPASLPPDVHSFFPQRIQDESYLDIAQLEVDFQSFPMYNICLSFFAKTLPTSISFSVLHIVLEKKDWRTEEEKQLIVQDQETRIIHSFSSNLRLRNKQNKHNKHCKSFFPYSTKRWIKTLLFLVVGEHIYCLIYHQQTKIQILEQKYFFPDDTFDRGWFLGNLEELLSGDTAKINLDD